MPTQSPYTGAPNDFDGLVGSWTVRHRRLTERLAGCTTWEDFDGTSTLWTTLGGLGTVDDNLLNLPSGAYRAMTLRAFNLETRQWSVWWLDARRLDLDPPVRGGFTNGVGTFIGDDVFKGRPIIVRFRWTHITPTSAHWDQAFSPDGGDTWEENWHMDFTRAG